VLLFWLRLELQNLKEKRTKWHFRFSRRRVWRWLSSSINLYQLHGAITQTSSSRRTSPCHQIKTPTGLMVGSWRHLTTPNQLHRWLRIESTLGSLDPKERTIVHSIGVTWPHNRSEHQYEEKNNVSDEKLTRPSSAFSLRLYYYYFLTSWAYA
jgi:hypothetical protein